MIPLLPSPGPLLRAGEVQKALQARYDYIRLHHLATNHLPLGTKEFVEFLRTSLAMLEGFLPEEEQPADEPKPKRKK